MSAVVKQAKNHNYDEMSEDEKVTLLSGMLTEKETYSGSYDLLSDDLKVIVDVFKTMILLREQVSPEAFGHYIISMTHDASHVLEVMLIAKMVGLIGEKDNGEVFCNILITPLFETVDDLTRINIILESLFSNEVYIKFLQCHEDNLQAERGAWHGKIRHLHPQQLTHEGSCACVVIMLLKRRLIMQPKVVKRAGFARILQEVLLQQRQRGLILLSTLLLERLLHWQATRLPLLVLMDQHV